MNASGKAVIRVALALSVAGLLTIGAHALRFPSAASDYSCTSNSTEEVQVAVAAGESGSSIALTLFTLGVVRSQSAFFALAISDKGAAAIAPGVHLVNTKLCAVTALAQLLDSKRIVGLLNIQEGARQSEVIDQMVSLGYSKKALLLAIREVKLSAPFKQVEGLLFPAQYSFAKGTSAATAIDHIVTNGLAQIKAAGLMAPNLKYSGQELLTIASIIEAEGHLKDFSKISRVIRNRLAIDMPLQMDSTVHYIEQSRGRIFLSTKSTLVASKYNTYKYYGLPPGPIGNPGRAAMAAVLHPAAGDWLFFITVAPGDTRFTKSMAEFSGWKVIYQKNLSAGLFRSEK